MSAPQVIVVGGGAAGFFAAITCAESNPSAQVTILERAPQFLAKVRISGGGRCNVTHHCFDSREFTQRYPRGQRELISPFLRFQARDTVDWFESRGVTLKAESDGRMFPVTDSSQTIVDCLVNAARNAGIRLRPNCTVEAVQRRSGGGFELSVARGERLECEQLLLATGGCRTPALAALATSLRHSIELPVPSLFTFHVETPWLRDLAGISIPEAEVRIHTTQLIERGPLLITHWGLSGPSVLRLSAWGARALGAMNYRFDLHVNWLPPFNADTLAREFASKRSSEGAKLVLNSPVAPLPGRLWEQLVLASGLNRETRWSSMTRAGQQALTRQLTCSEFQVTGKSLNKDEFVTCGGVKLREVNFKTMESRICPGLYFAGEVLDIDGITGGFNFQAAWTTGWIAGQTMAASLRNAISSAEPGP